MVEASSSKKVDMNDPRTLESLMAECTDFRKMRTSWKQSSFPDAGTPVFLINKKWDEKYKQYLFYRDVINNNKPEWEEDHPQKAYPGPISNEELLNTDDKYLVGTGDKAEFEKEVFDRYLIPNLREIADYEVYSEEMFTFVNEKYGIDLAIKRYYRKGAYMYSTSLETKFKQVPVLIIRCDELKAGTFKGEKQYV